MSEMNRGRCESSFNGPTIWKAAEAPCGGAMVHVSPRQIAPTPPLRNMPPVDLDRDLGNACPGGCLKLTGQDSTQVDSVRRNFDIEATTQRLKHAHHASPVSQPRGGHDYPRPARRAVYPSTALGRSARQRQTGPFISTHLRHLPVLMMCEVYDLTDYATDHPGGIDVLKDSAGTDATESFDYAGHPQSAMQSMAKFCVGRLHGSQPSPDSGSTSPPPPSTTSSTPPAARRGSGANAELPWRALAQSCLAAGCVVLALLAVRGTGGASRFETLSMSVVHGSNSAAFALGLAAAGSVSAAAFAVLYVQFLKTMELERDVFSYPSVIPNPKRARRNAAVVFR